MAYLAVALAPGVVALAAVCASALAVRGSRVTTNATLRHAAAHQSVSIHWSRRRASRVRIAGSRKVLVSSALPW